VVIGGDHTGLGVARSLGRAGIPVVVLDDQFSLSKFSRYVTKVVRVEDLRTERGTVDAILEAGKRLNLKDWVLFPTRDETVVAVARYRDELAAFFKVTTAEWSSVQWAWNKKNTYDLAEKLGIPCPKTFNPRSLEELKPLYARLPLAIKPAVKENFFYATKAKAWRAETPERLRELFIKASEQIPLDEILIQEIIPGDGSTQYSYCAFFRDGKAHNTLMATRTRQHPREFGRAATYVESIDVPEIVEPSERFLKEIDFYGIVEVEYKWDHRDGKYKLLDVNARTWGFQNLGASAGVDFCRVLWNDQMGMPVTPSRGQAGVGWLRLITDFPVAVSDMAHGYLNLGSYLRSLGKTRAEAVFCKDDPLPFFAEFAMLPYIIAKKYL
jgi:predicted ATP-grasp superfamily ATP-dependent carboligase